jgi:hypothetical protein
MSKSSNTSIKSEDIPTQQPIRKIYTENEYDSIQTKQSVPVSTNEQTMNKTNNSE